MKRAGFLIAQITDLNNLYAAYYKASKGKKQKDDVQQYSKKLYSNLRILQQQIETGNVSVGNYKYFTIFEPKERLICAASFSERVLHHAIMNICHPYFENQQINESYATRTDKGTYKALEKAEYFSKHYKYYLKCDIRKYFDSISHLILNEKLNKMFKDQQLLTIFESIIGSYKVQENKGLPIGNLTSQYFANFYLSELDRFIKNNLLIKPYVRYMDDFILWSNNAQQLTQIGEQIEIFLNRFLSLSLKLKYTNTTSHGLNFLSYRIFDNRIELQQKSKKRFIKKLKKYETNIASGTYTQAEYQQHITPLIAFTEHASAKGFRKKVFQTMNLCT